MIGSEWRREGPYCGICIIDIGRCNNIGEAVALDDEISIILFPIQVPAHLTYASATSRHLLPSPPTTSIGSFFKEAWPLLSCAKDANGVWLCTNMLVSSETPNLLLSSATLSDSCFPPPLVRRMKGMPLDWSASRACFARGIGSELLMRTPSILSTVRVEETSDWGHFTRRRMQTQPCCCYYADGMNATSEDKEEVCAILNADESQTL